MELMTDPSTTPDAVPAPPTTRPAPAAPARAAKPAKPGRQPKPGKAPKAARGPLGVASVAVSIIFGLLYAYDVYEAIVSWVALAQAFGAVGFALTTSLVLTLLLAAIMPVIILATVMWLGWRRTWWELSLMYLAGWALSNALFVTLSVAISGGPPA
jgi:hypothetical protein